MNGAVLLILDFRAELFFEHAIYSWAIHRPAIQSTKMLTEEAGFRKFGLQNDPHDQFHCEN
jgi:hypothetical protein